MKLTLKELDKMWPAIQILVAHRALPPAKKQLFFRLVRIAEPEVMNFRENRNSIVKKHGQLAKNSTDIWHILPANEATYRTELTALEDLPVELPDVAFTEQELSEPLTVAEMLCMQKLVQDSPEQA